MEKPFVHLHLHSEYSLVDGTARINDLAPAAATMHTPALAMTDVMNLFGAVKFYRAAIKAGVKPIIGAEVWLERTEERQFIAKLILLCCNQQGYLNLCKLLSRAYLEGAHHQDSACINKAWLKEYSDGLIALSAAQDGEIGHALAINNTEQAEALAQEYTAWFPGNFYLELQRTGHTNQEDILHATVALAQKTDLPVVATNNVRFIKADGFDAHEARVCIYEGRVLNDQRRPRHYTTEQYLRTPDEMHKLFEDIPEALENTVAIAMRCNLQLEFGNYHLPRYPIPENKKIEDALEEQSIAGLEARFKTQPPVVSREEYMQRLKQELGVINSMGFPGYFLIVADFILWAKNNDIIVGPGRGSGAGSLVAYALGITELDPIEHHLLFERFLNPERISLPDFDIDFCMEKRDRVIEYVTTRYGKEKVAQIITYGSMAARAVLRDVGRVLGHPYGYVDKLAKLVPFEIGMTLDRALEQEPMLKEQYENEEEVRILYDMARALEGLPRNAGKHAGGVVIAPTALTDFMPLYCEQGGKQQVTQFDKDDLEALGLVKFDFLGLRNLTIIDKAVKRINATLPSSETLRIEQLPLDDEKTYSLLKACKTTATFQLESRGMKDLIQRLQPDSFDEIVALVALFRPGPLQSGMVDDFIDREHGRGKIEYLHPSLEPILKPTYGVILYQEQVMQIAQILSGYTLGKADLLRRAMGKKKPEEMALQRKDFVEGAKERGVKSDLATRIFDLIEKFAGYGFNRSHSAAYALIAYQTAWLKAHYPAEFMAAVLSADMDHTDKVVTMIAECENMGLNVSPPNINLCEYEFVTTGDETIHYGLGAIKGLGEAALNVILETRNENGKFKDLFELCQRVDLRKVNKRSLESLIRSGTLDQLGPNRATMMASLTKAVQAADQHIKNAEAGQQDLFAINAEQTQSAAPDYIDAEDWSDEERLNGEKETLGLYLSGHPIERYTEELKNIVTATIAELKPNAQHNLIVAGLIVAIRVMRTRRGDRMAFITLDDRTGRLELAVFSELFMTHRELLQKDKLIIVEGPVSIDEYTGGFKMSAEKLLSIDDARTNYARRLIIKIDEQQAGNGFMEHLKQILEPVRQGPCPVYVHYHNAQAKAEFKLGKEWTVNLTDPMLEQLAQLTGQENIQIEYR